VTLILTWLFPEGIIMGTDSAVTQPRTTPTGRTFNRILTGLKKVFHIPKINAGISCWGKGNIGDYTVDVWLPDFISSHEEEYDTIHGFALLLQNELRDIVPVLTAPEGSYEYRYGNRGFHLSGYVEYNGQQIPTFYHIHNGLSETYPDINPRIINANHDLPPKEVLRLFLKNIAPHVRNGDFMLYSMLLDIITNLFDSLHKKLTVRGRPFIFPNIPQFEHPLEGLSEFVRFWIRLVRDVYALSNLPEIIGGEIYTLSIAPTGETQLSVKP